MSGETYISSIGSTTPPPSTPECRSGRALVICCKIRIDQRRVCFGTHLQITVDNASKTICDARMFLSDPHRVTNVKTSIIHQCPHSDLYT